MDKLLSGKEVEQIANRPIKTTSSSDFYKLTNINDLFPIDCNSGLILFEDKSLGNIKSGHFCAIKRLGNKIIFFDSYGGKPGNQLKYIKDSYRKETNQIANHLAKLMYYSNYDELHYNQFKFQRMKKDINTCGRHAGLFLRFDKMPEEYKDIMDDLIDKLNIGSGNYDELSNLLTKNIIKN